MSDLEDKGDSMEKEERRRLKHTSKLTALFEERIDQPDASVRSLNNTFIIFKEETGQITLTIPSELENYLSPDLWRRLNSSTLSRNVLIETLEQFRSILYLISTFLPRHLVQEKMRRPYIGLAQGQLLHGTLLFSDISGFTSLSERLAEFGKEGAERLTTVINKYFTEMLDILTWSGGILLKFAGDAALVYFPEQEHNQQACWAVRAGKRMMRSIANFTQVVTPSGLVELRMKIGVATGQFLAASLGSTQRMEYVIVGQAVAKTMAAESILSTTRLLSAAPVEGGGQLVMDKTIAKALSKDLETRIHQLGDNKVAERL